MIDPADLRISQAGSVGRPGVVNCRVSPVVKKQRHYRQPEHSNRWRDTPGFMGTTRGERHGTSNRIKQVPHWLVNHGRVSASRKASRTPSAGGPRQRSPLPLIFAFMLRMVCGAAYITGYRGDCVEAALVCVLSSR